MLGDHQLQTAVQVGGGGLDDFVAQAAYLNMSSRWNWGIVGGQVPSLLGTRSTPAVLADGQLSRDRDVYRQLHREIGAVAIYPFSSVQRAELTAGVHTISFDRRRTTSIY